MSGDPRYRGLFIEAITFDAMAQKRIVECEDELTKMAEVKRTITHPAGERAIASVCAHVAGEATAWRAIRHMIDRIHEAEEASAEGATS